MKMYKTILALVTLASMVGGCSANHFIGESSQNSGFRIHKGAWGDFDARWDTNGSASANKVTVQATATQKVVEIDQPKFAQTDVEKVNEINIAKVEAVGKAQMTQVAYVKALGEATAAVGEAVADCIASANPVGGAVDKVAKVVDAVAKLKAVAAQAPAPASQPAASQPATP